ncbi:MAG: hypothetical protein KDC87_01830 [Planctomycetes bacterium]|nr:hypothetical protein [Planctomycetota bacterium]
MNRQTPAGASCAMPSRVVRRRWHGVVAVLLGCATLAAQRGGKAAGAGEIVAATQGDIRYHVFHPSGVRKGHVYPLVFALHGNGQRAEAHLQNLKAVSTAALPVFLVAPHYQQEAKFGAPVIPQAGASFDQILAKLLAALPIDPSRVVLQGFSMGSNYATGWLNALGARAGASGGKVPHMPFCAVWLNGTAVEPRRPLPKLPYLLFCGERETAVLGRIDIRAQVRGTYLSMFDAGADVTYLEVPGMGHTVDAECRRLMAAFLHDLPDHSGALPTRLRRALPEAYEQCRSGAFDRAFATFDRIVAAGKDKVAEARTARERLRDYLTTWARQLARGEPSVSAGVQQLRGLNASVGARPDLTAKLHEALAKQRADVRAARELHALEAWVALPRADPSARIAALRALATGPGRDTTFGKRARAHLQAMGESEPYPFGAPTAPRRGKRRG